MIECVVVRVGVYTHCYYAVHRLVANGKRVQARQEEGVDGIRKKKERTERIYFESVYEVEHYFRNANNTMNVHQHRPSSSFSFSLFGSSMGEYIRVRVRASGRVRC